LQSGFHPLAGTWTVDLSVNAACGYEFKSVILQVVSANDVRLAHDLRLTRALRELEAITPCGFHSLRADQEIWPASTELGISNYSPVTPPF
jgi:hypothetical protein